MFTSNVVRPLLKQVEIYKTPWLLWEDMFVTGVLRNLSNIPLYNIKGFSHATCNSERGRPSSDHAISYHRVYRQSHIYLFNNKPCKKRFAVLSVGNSQSRANWNIFSYIISSFVRVVVQYVLQ